MTVRRSTAGARRHTRRAVAFDGVRLTLAGHAPRGALRRMPARCRGGSQAQAAQDVMRWVGVGEPAGAVVRSW
ncbi:MAG: hypothetical protein H0X35_06020 [Pseudonocardiales bacterium]|nr:hypothetical protein [Pseudonocardiales bacterium]